VDLPSSVEGYLGNRVQLFIYIAVDLLCCFGRIEVVRPFVAA
jgi:hypothetical protein